MTLFSSYNSATTTESEPFVGYQGGGLAISTQMIPYHLGVEATLRFAMTAQRCYEIGLVNRVVPQDKLMPTAKEIAEHIVGLAPLADRLYHLAKEHGFTCNNVSIREQRTRWGSCSHKNNISLNLKLVLLPKELIDYVMLHELVHTRIHNHSKKFWAELDRYTGNGKVMA